MRRLAKILVFVAFAMAGCGEDAEPTRPNTFVPLTSLEAAADPASVPAGTFSRVAATGDFSGVFNRDLSGEVVWTSSDEMVATVSEEPGQEGVVLVHSPGAATLTAETEGFTASTDLTVTDAVVQTLVVSPQAGSIANGLTRQVFTVEGTFSDGTVMDLTPVAEWTSGDISIAQVGRGFEDGGRITALASGETIISTAFDGISATAGLTVTGAELDSLEIDPASPDLPDGFSLQFTALATFTDGSSENVTEETLWESSNQTVATILNSAGEKGLAEGLTPGQTRITAIFGGLEAETIFTVTDVQLERIEFPDNIQSRILVGESLTFTTTGFFSDNTERDLTESATFTSSDETVAQISNVEGRRGVLTAIARGIVTITAEVGGRSISHTLNIR